MGANLIINMLCVLSALFLFIPQGMYGAAASLLAVVATLSLLTQGLLRTREAELRGLKRSQVVRLLISRAFSGK